MNPITLQQIEELTKKEKIQLGNSMTKFLANEMSLQKRHKQSASAKNQLEAGIKEGEIENGI